MIMIMTFPYRPNLNEIMLRTEQRSKEAQLHKI